MIRAAAFFDLDRTFIRGSSALALGGAFRAHGVLSRRQLAKGAVWKLRFAARGADGRAVRDATADGMRVLHGLRPAEVEQLIAGSLERKLRPLVYPEAVELAAEHRRRGEAVFLVTATLQEIADALAAALGLDGAVGSLCEVATDGRFTGRALRACHGAEKATAVRELAAERGFDLAASTAYSDGHTDLPLLEAVGRPVAVNPDRALRRIARERGWPVLDFRRRALRLVG